MMFIYLPMVFTGEFTMRWPLQRRVAHELVLVGQRLQHRWICAHERRELAREHHGQVDEHHDVSVADVRIGLSGTRPLLSGGAGPPSSRSAPA